MTSPLSDSLGGHAASPSLVEASQQRRVQKALERLPPSPEESGRASNADELVKAAQRVNETLRPYGVQFEMREESGQVITRIVERESGEMIRQIPSEAVLRAAERLDEFQGLLLDEKA